MQSVESSVIIYAYQHVRLFPPEPLVVKQPKPTRVKGAGTVMQSSGFLVRHSPGYPI